MALLYCILSTALTLFLCSLTRWRIKKSHGGLPLPPGPRGSIFFGHLFELPANSPWEVYHQWCKDLGSDIIHLDIMGSSVIILDTATAAMDLIEKRSSIYSDRSKDYFFAGSCLSVLILGLGFQWRSHRRLFHRFFHPSAAARFQPQEMKATHEMLGRLLDDDQDFVAHFRHMAGAVIMSIAYGIEVLPHNDPYIVASERGVRPVINAAVPGAYLVDLIPLLKYVPEWMPFANFRRKARDDRDSTHQTEIIKNTAATMYMGGSDSTVSMLSSFILAMLKNPEAQAKAQQELDETLEHQKNLPYVDAIVMEVLRWGTIAPLAAPHRLAVDDAYQGYALPAGSTILCNAWAMLHDENEYPQPFLFNPDRFIRDGKINPAVKDPRAFAFGFGRRVCPARFMAYSSAWIAVASILSVFNITQAVADDGSLIDPAIEYTGTLAWSQDAKAMILLALGD
ncbi:cytochrome P450 [Infundibulicybe gibba]|nr:cytochrome P450 [Infundibulicybe gibba]